MVMRIATPVHGSASQETSGSWRALPGRAFWNHGFGKPARQSPLESCVAQLLAPPPPPPSNPNASGGSAMKYPSVNSVSLLPQPACHRIELLLFRATVTPPTAVAHGE